MIWCQKELTSLTNQQLQTVASALQWIKKERPILDTVHLLDIHQWQLRTMLVKKIRYDCLVIEDAPGNATNREKSGCLQCAPVG